MNKRKTLLYQMTLRTVLFLFLFLSALILFYIIGNYQQFLDSNQKTILLLATITAILLVSFSSAGFLESLFYLIKRDYTGHCLSYIIRMVLMVFSAATGTAVMFFTRTISFLSGKF
jgi:hypothetical protein